MIEVLFCVVYCVGMFLYLSLWMNLVDRSMKYGDALPVTFQMATWPVAFFWLCYKFNKGELK